MFVGRKKELDFLNERYQSAKAELIVLYGRRRIGKTELLHQFAKDKQAVFYACNECTDDEQLARFSRRMLATGMPASQYVNTFETWETALKSMLELPGDGKKLLIIDEFPYMAQGSRAIPSILQNLWDHVLQREHVMLVLCGSSISFIERDLLGEKNPLYGRATGIYRLQPLSFRESRGFFPHSSLQTQLTYYAILGGIPHYLQQFDDDASIGENVEKQILRRGSILSSEVEFLLHQELRETAVYNVIIEAIAQGCTTLNAIHERTQLDSTKINAYLRNLMELGLVEREFSVLALPRERTARGRGIYRLSDAFFRFWYAFCYGNASDIAAGDGEELYQYQIEPGLQEFVSQVFEQVSLEALRCLNQQNALPFHFTKAGRWWDKVTHDADGKKRTVAEEIDIVATDAKASEYLLCECKYRKEKTGLSVLHRLRGKFPLAKHPGRLHYALFSFWGFSEELERQTADEQIALFDGERLDQILRE